MSDHSQVEITFDSLKQFLVRVGFEQAAKMNHSLAFQHQESGTLIILSIPEDGRSVRPADLLSVEMRLENQGLVDEATLSQFKSRKLFMAS